MATTVRGGGAGAGREKRGTSPSPSLVKKSPKPSTSSSSSPTDKEKAASSPTAGKPVPNYLKPTLSSKRSNTDSSTQKPALDRRRSFDRPPTSSQVQKAIRSSTSTLKEVRPVRSSSFSNKTVSTPLSSSPRPALDRQSTKTSEKGVKGESSLSKSRSLKKSTLSSTGTSKRDSIGGGIPKKKAPKSVTSESSIDYENRSSVDHAGIEDDIVNIDNEVASLPEISEMPDSNEELGDPTNLEIEATHVVEEQKVEPSLDHEDKPAVVDEVVEETVPPVSESPEVHQEEKEEQTVEKQPEKEIVEEPADQQVEVQSGEKNQTEECLEVQEAETPKVETTEEKLEEEKTEEVSLEKIAEEKEEKESATSPSAPEAASTAAAAPAKTQTTPAGKKENQAYNAVIEETATKLMGKRNKVLALAGAFETVISLQDNNKN